MREPLTPAPGRDGGPPPDAAVRAELEAILASRAFREAEHLKRFLRYSVEHTLRGEGGLLKEYRLAVDVFDRDSSFDPRLDPVVRMAARRLRAKLREYYDADGQEHLLRIDVPKGGYAASLREIRPADLRGETALRQRLRPALWAAAVLVLSAAFLAYYLAPAWRPRAPALPYRESSIAVLPFLNLTGRQEDEYLGDGFADELTGALAALPGLRVIARTSAFKFKGKAEDVRSIGSQLSVASLVEGSLQRNGEQLRITVQLIRTSDGSHLWAETYDRDARNIFAVEDEVSRSVSRMLGLVTRGAFRSSANRRSVDPEAHDLYWRGRYWWNQRTPPAVWKSIGYFNQALAKDPVYAQAYVGLASAYTVLGFNDQAAANEVVPKARAAAAQALALDDTLGEARAVLAAAAMYHDWDFALAQQEFQRAIQLSPNLSTAHQWYGLLLLSQRRFEDARRQFAEAQRLDPLSLMIALDIGQVDYYSGHLEAAGREAQKALAQYPDFAMAHDLLGMTYERQKRIPEAIAEFNRYLEASGQDPDAVMRMALAYADAGDRSRALALVKQLQTAPSGGYAPAYDSASVYAALGERDLAFEWLERAVARRESSCLLLAVDPAYDAIRSDPRFQKAARQVGLDAVSF